jgi:epoxyqueuosine reductase QueG
LARNIALALGNREPSDAKEIDTLTTAAAHDADPMVRDQAKWALERIASRSAPGTD